VGLQSQSLVGLDISSSADSLELISEALGKQRTAIAEKAAAMIALNAGAALYAADIADSLREGVPSAQDAIASGLAGEEMLQLATATSACTAVCP